MFSRADSRRVTLHTQDTQKSKEHSSIKHNSEATTNSQSKTVKQGAKTKVSPYKSVRNSKEGKIVKGNENRIN